MTRPRRLLTVCLGNYCCSHRRAHPRPARRPAVAVRSADIRDRGALYLGDRDVPEPFGKGPGAFADVVALIEEGAARHLP
jgi:protein-tyrosine-phosphatase